MGMFDEVKYKSSRYQTKDLESFMDYYFVDRQGYIVKKVCEYDWIEEPECFLGGYLSEKFHYWKPMPDFTGYINIYNSEENLYLFFFNGRVFCEIHANSIDHDVNGFLTKALYTVLDTKESTKDNSQ